MDLVTWLRWEEVYPVYLVYLAVTWGNSSLVIHTCHIQPPLAEDPSKSLNTLFCDMKS